MRTETTFEKLGALAARHGYEFLQPGTNR